MVGAINMQAAYPALHHFMQCYWMETADLVYGGIEGAAQAFRDIESSALREALLQDIVMAATAGYVVRRQIPGSGEEAFWAQGGARWIAPEDLKPIRTILQDGAMQ